MTRITTSWAIRISLLAALPLACGFILPQCGGLETRHFKQICVNGFDAEDNAEDYNDYPWSMEYFTPDGADDGNLYVGTGNGVDELVYYLLGVKVDELPAPPPEIRRYRPDLGEKQWERVFDYRDVDDGPQYTSFGFRNMTVYRSQNDGVARLYASTYGKLPSIWRSATGDPGSWEFVWSPGAVGSLRWMAEHNGLLYIAISNELVIPPSPAAIWATDGATIWPVMQDGFGNANNSSVMSMISFNGYLYAGTANPVNGYEIWKLEGPDDAPPVKIVGKGGGDWRNQAACMPILFNNALFWGTLSLPPSQIKGCELIRIQPNDSWQTIVGPRGLSGYGPGFDNRMNSYLWWMEEHQGWLYAGTFDLASAVQGVIDNAEYLDDVVRALPGLPERVRNYMHPVDAKAANGGPKREQSPFSRLSQAGADMFKSIDGVHWTPVTLTGFNDPYNWGLRTMVSVGDDLFVGMANPFEGLEIWLGHDPASDSVKTR